MEKWFIRDRAGDFKKIARDFKIPEITAKLLLNRDINNNRAIDSFINPSLDRLHSPDLLKDIHISIDILEEKIKNKKTIRIIGDYDVDGVVSVYMLYTSIKKCGGIVDYEIPDRVNDGYGLNKNMVKLAYETGIDTIITCDNGIAAIEEIDYAKELGMTVIVTDHHDLPFIESEGKRELIYVNADAIVNPRREDCNYPFDKLCGAGVVYKLIEKLYERFNINKEEVTNFLEYTAIATICDVVDLVDENRIIVKKGLEMLNETKNIGLKSLIEVSELEDTEIGVYHVGFILGPSINASGRLDTALKALELLLCKDEEAAKEMASSLRALNNERKEMTQDGTEKIIRKVDETDLNKDTVLVVYDPTIHESIAGIIAGRIKDKYHKPTIVLTKSVDGIKGSARSIENYNIFEELTKRKHLLNRFGGHPMAAGLSLDLENIDKLRKELNDNNLTKNDLVPKIYIDLPLALDKISYRLIKELERLEPFGKGNSRPLFGDKNISLIEGRVLGQNRNVLKLTLLTEDRRSLEGMIFNDIAEFEDLIMENYGQSELENLYNGLPNDIRLDIIYYPSINEFRGKTTLQSILKSYRISR